jgi:phage tail-like protein
VADLTGDPAVSMCFCVEVDGWDLGVFSACEGLGCEVVLEPLEEGGNNEFIHQFPVRMKFSNIKLTRPINGDSATVARWFASMAGVVKRTNARIVAMTLEEKPIAVWSLRDVIPVRWQGPSLNVETVKAATETLELAHHGFLELA